MFASLFIASCFLFLGANVLFFVYRNKKKIGLAKVIMQNIVLFCSSFITLYFHYKIADFIAVQNKIDDISDILVIFAMVAFCSLVIVFTAGKQKFDVKRFFVLLLYTVIFYVAMYIQYTLIKS